MKLLGSLLLCGVCVAAASTKVPVRVIHGESGKAMPNARLRLGESPSPGWGKKFTSLATDDEGRAEVPMKAGGGVSVEAMQPGFVGPNILIAQGATRFRGPVELKLWPGTKVTGRILEPDGVPAANAQISVGVYLMSDQWRRRFGIDRIWYSWDHGQWPNWRTMARTDQDGRFHCTVPPREARSWIRVGSSTLSFARLNDAVLAKMDPKPLALRFAPFERDYESENEGADGVDMGEIRLRRGVVLRGLVRDAEGRPMEGVHLMTSGKHGPYAGRGAISNERGEFRFFPQAPGQRTISVDARHRDATGKVISRDVRAVFAKVPLTLSELAPELEVIVQANPFETLEFQWVDRRKPPSKRISYYDHLTVTGQIEINGQLQSWRGETQRQGDVLFVKAPVGLQKAQLILPNDKFARISYEDDSGLKGQGRVDLPNLDPKLKRIVYGDPPLKP